MRPTRPRSLPYRPPPCRAAWAFRRPRPRRRPCPSPILCLLPSRRPPWRPRPPRRSLSRSPPRRPHPRHPLLRHPWRPQPGRQPLGQRLRPRRHRRQPLWRHRWRLHHPRPPLCRPHPRRPLRHPHRPQPYRSSAGTPGARSRTARAAPGARSRPPRGLAPAASGARGSGAPTSTAPHPRPGPGGDHAGDGPRRPAIARSRRCLPRLLFEQPGRRLVLWPVRPPVARHRSSGGGTDPGPGFSDHRQADDPARRHTATGVPAGHASGQRRSARPL